MFWIIHNQTIAELQFKLLKIDIMFIIIITTIIELCYQWETALYRRVMFLYILAGLYSEQP
jgi:hypothetical protein